MSLSIQADSHLDGDGDPSNKSAGRWTQEEHNLFLLGLQTHQKQWKLIADMVKTRTVVQIRTHAQKYFQKLNKTSGGGANWNKFDKSDDPSSPFSDQDGQRSFAYPVADSRANSFCSSGDSVDSNGTSAEGNDSEGEAHGQRGANHLASGAGAKPPRLNVGMYGYDPSGSSGHTSTANSNMNSPTAAGHSTFLMAQMHQQQQLKRQSQLNAKAKGGGDLVRKRSRDSIKTMVPADGIRPPPFSPKKGAYDPHFATNMKTKPDPDVHPGRVHGGTGAAGGNVAFRTSMFPGNPHHGQAAAAPGPLCGLPDDLGVGMGLGLDVTASDLFFPSFPEDAYSSYGGHLASRSNDTDLTNPYFSQHASGCSVGSAGIAPIFDDADLADILGTIDWDEPVPTHVDSLSSTSTSSRPLSPSTDTSSSVGTAPYMSMSYGGRYAAGSTMTVASMSPKKIPSPIPSSQCISALGQSSAQPPRQQIGGEREGSACDDAPVVKKHRVAFSNVLEELELVSEAVRGSNSSSGARTEGARSSPSDADHISLFDLFQRDATQSVGRLPPLRALVEQARERRGKTGSSTGTGMGVGCADTTARFGAPAEAPVGASSGNGAVVDFDAHEFDFGSLMDDDAHPMDCSCAVHLDAHHPLGGHSSMGGFHPQVDVCNVPVNNGPCAPAPASRASSGDLFSSGSGILDANGAINPVGGALLNISMMPSAGGLGSAPPSANTTPAVVQRKRGRPRKHSITAPGAPIGTPGTATAKSLLPALHQPNAMHGGPFQGHSLPDGQGYIVPVNPTVAQAYSYAVNSAAPSSSSGHADAASGTYAIQNTRSVSADSTSSLSFRLSLNSNSGFAGSGNYFGPDIRLGITRTMSTESDTMMAGMFDPKLYDSHDVKLGMLEDFE